MLCATPRFTIDSAFGQSARKISSVHFSSLSPFTAFLPPSRWLAIHSTLIMPISLNWTETKLILYIVWPGKFEFYLNCIGNRNRCNTTQIKRAQTHTHTIHAHTMNANIHKHQYYFGQKYGIFNLITLNLIKIHRMRLHCYLSRLAKFSIAAMF